MNKFNPDWLRRFNIIHDEAAEYISDPNGAWVYANDHDRAIMEQAAEYQEIINRLRAQLENLAAYNKSYIKQVSREMTVLQDKNDALKADLAAARRCGSCLHFKKCYRVHNTDVDEFLYAVSKAKNTCDNWEVI